MDMDTLHRHLLLALAAVAIERFEERRIGAGELIGLARFSRRPSNICSATPKGKDAKA
jgi:hypothetical protein